MTRIPAAVLLLVATSATACGPMSHAAIRSELLDPATGRASAPFPGAPSDRLRVAFYGDSQGNTRAHRAVVAAILAEKPDLVLFAGDAIDHLPAGHMPDWGGWQYAVPFWPQHVRGYAWVSLLSIIPFPAVIHETLLGAVAPPRPLPDLNGWLEDTAPFRKAGIPVLAAMGNHDQYHVVDQAQFTRILSPPGGPELSPDGFWYAVDRGGFRFVVLDTGTDMFGDRDPMPRGGAQLTWLEATLAEADRAGLRTIVMLHVPPFSSGREERGAPWVARRVVEEILDRHPVALVLSGHVHAYERIVRPGLCGAPVNYVVSGGAGGRFFRAADRREEGSQLFVEGVRNFVLLELGPDGVSGRVIPVKVEGEEWRKPPSPIDTFEVDAAPSGATCSARSPSAR
ncbi:MAG: metallophosphoesterase [Anaeromyxobacteraceae bacterium]